MRCTARSSIQCRRPYKAGLMEQVLYITSMRRLWPHLSSVRVEREPPISKNATLPHDSPPPTLFSRATAGLRRTYLGRLIQNQRIASRVGLGSIGAGNAGSRLGSAFGVGTAGPVQNQDVNRSFNPPRFSLGKVFSIRRFRQFRSRPQRQTQTQPQPQPQFHDTPGLLPSLEAPLRLSYDASESLRPSTTSSSPGTFFSALSGDASSLLSQNLTLGSSPPSSQPPKAVTIRDPLQNVPEAPENELASSPPVQPPQILAVGANGPTGIRSRDFAFESGQRPPLQGSLHGSSSVLSFHTAPPGSPPRPPSFIPTGVEIVRCDSPRPIWRRPPSSAQRPSSLRDSIVPSVPGPITSGFPNLEHDHQISDMPHSPPPSTKSATTSTNTSDTPERKILIIGSPYEKDAKGNRRTATMFSITTLAGVHEESKKLGEAFEERNYAVEVLVNNTFDRKVVIDKVTQFVHDAKSGDVRAVAFTGHAYRSDDGTVMIIPPHCPNQEMAISKTEWEEIINASTNPGAIIFSIMAHCFSGEFMRQKLDYPEWAQVVSDSDSDSDTKTNQAIYVTFSSSAGDQAAFQSGVERRNSEYISDHFVYALVGAMADVRAKTWNEFFAAFQSHFNNARSCASFYAQDDQEEPGNEAGGSSWRTANPQVSCFTASRRVRFSVVF